MPPALRRAPDSAAPRSAAIWLIGQVIEDGRLLADLTDAPIVLALDPAGRARAMRLATETLRQLSRADRLLAPHLARRPPNPVMQALRLATVELAQGAAAHGVINDIVGILGADPRLAGLKGLANAVLRKVALADPSAWAALPVPQMPGWLRAPVVRAWGRPGAIAIEAAHLAGAPLDLTAKGDAAEVAALTGGIVLPTGSVRLAEAGQVSALPGYADGLWWVQDAAAALPARALGPVAGLRVLDLCAAPGGKTMQLAAAGADVTALDASAARLERLGENLSRTGLRALIVCKEVEDYTEGGWDAILLDAPCSATGTIRRHPDLCFARDGSKVGVLAARQAAMIDHALGLLRPGGKLVYAVCSLLTAEGEMQAASALARHPGLAVDRGALDLPGLSPDWITPEGGARIRPDDWPDRGGLDGFYIVAFRKPG